MLQHSLKGAGQSPLHGGSDLAGVGQGLHHSLGCKDQAEGEANGG